MISDTEALRDARDAWEFVRKSRNVIVGNCNVATIASSFNQRGIRDMCFNLLLASAFSVLEHVLQELRDQGDFACKGNQHGGLMVNSKASIPWVDYTLIDKARSDRNESIHQQRYIPHAQCRDYIAAVEIELVAWKVLTETTPDLWHW